MKAITSSALRKKIGKQIHQIRKDQKISQEQLAFESGLSRVEISYLENGKKNVTVETLRLIANALQVQVKKFFDFE